MKKPSIELTEDEKKNGWTEETLRRYLKERTHAASMKVLEGEKDLIVTSQTQFNPKRDF